MMPERAEQVQVMLNETRSGSTVKGVESMEVGLLI